MPELSDIIASALGSLFTGLVLIGVAPLWWEKAKKWKNVLGFEALVVLGLGGLVVFAVWIYPHFRTETYWHHDTMTPAEQRIALAECVLRAEEGSVNVPPRRPREEARSRIMNACRRAKGFYLREKNSQTTKESVGEAKSLAR